MFTGKSGSGKSYLVKLEVLRSLMFGTEIVIIDPNQSTKVCAPRPGAVFDLWL
jgi:type IV secretory pathway VirB4 component